MIVNNGLMYLIGSINECIVSICQDLCMLIVNNKFNQNHMVVYMSYINPKKSPPYQIHKITPSLFKHHLQLLTSIYNKKQPKSKQKQKQTKNKKTSTFHIRIPRLHMMLHPINHLLLRGSDIPVLLVAIVDDRLRDVRVQDR